METWMFKGARPRHDNVNGRAPAWGLWRGLWPVPAPTVVPGQGVVPGHGGAAWLRRAAAAILWVIIGAAGGTAFAHNPHDPVAAFGVSPAYATDRTLFVGGYIELNWTQPGLMRSSDGGASWTKLVKGLTNRFDFSAVLPSPDYANDGTVYASTLGDGVFRSTDRGQTWRKFNEGLPAQSPTIVVKRMVVGATASGAPVALIAIQNGGMFRRGPGDAAWVRVLPTPIDVKAMALAPDFAQSGVVALVESGGRLRLSSDGGVLWSDLGLPGGSTVLDVAIGPGSPSTIYLAAAASGLLQSIDGGATFSRLTAGLPTADGMNNVAVSPAHETDGTVFATAYTKAMYISRDRGVTWTLGDSRVKLTRQTLLEEEFEAIVPSPTYATDNTVFLPAYRGLFRSTNGGVRWSEIETRRDLLTDIAASATDGKMLVTTYAGQGIYASADNGATWAPANVGWPLEDGKVTAIAAEFVEGVEPARAVVARNFVLLGLTDDFGANWSFKPIPRVGPGSNGDVYPIVIGLSPAFATDGVVLLSTRRHGVVRSTDGGTTWQLPVGIQFGEHIVSLSLSPGFATDGTVFAGSQHGKMYRSTDFGVNWSRIAVGQVTARPVSHANVQVAVSPTFTDDRLVLAGLANGLHISRDGGATWAPFRTPAEVGPGRIIESIRFSPGFADDRQVFVRVRGEGLYRMQLGTTGTAVSSMVNIGAGLLEQNVQFVTFRLSRSYATDATMYGVSLDRVYRSTDGGATWQELGRPAGAVTSAVPAGAAKVPAR